MGSGSGEKPMSHQESDVSSPGGTSVSVQYMVQTMLEACAPFNPPWAGELQKLINSATPGSALTLELGVGIPALNIYCAPQRLSLMLSATVSYTLIDLMLSFLKHSLGSHKARSQLSQLEQRIECIDSARGLPSSSKCTTPSSSSCQLAWNNPSVSVKSKKRLKSRSHFQMIPGSSPGDSNEA